LFSSVSSVANSSKMSKDMWFLDVVGEVK
jgi:hypothetical protein